MNNVLKVSMICYVIFFENVDNILTITCKIMVAGPAQVDASSLQIIRPGVTYSLEVIISSEVTYGRVVITMAENTCTDQAGNRFTKTNDSTLTVHFGEVQIAIFNFVMIL